jgi:hypothetical protein
VEDSNVKNFSGYLEPWERTWREYEAYVAEYFDKHHQYPPEMKEIMDVAAKPHEVTPSLARQLAAPVHQILLIKALARARPIPSRVLEEYPLLTAKVPRRFPESAGNVRYGFDATDFGSAEKFITLLDKFKISRNYKECKYLDFPEALPLYLWEGEELHMITANNPLLKEGYCSYIGIEGKKAHVLQAVMDIETMTDSHSSKGLEYIGFENILCFHPEQISPSDAETVSSEKKSPAEEEGSSHTASSSGDSAPDDDTTSQEIESTESPSTSPGSGIGLLKLIEIAIEEDRLEEAYTIIRSMFNDVKEGIFIEMLPYLIQYRNKPVLKKRLSKLEFGEIMNSEKFCATLEVNLWTLLPEEIKTARPIKPVLWKADPADKGLRLLLQDFTGHEILRPQMWGANFDEQGITATDSRKLIFINNVSAAKRGIYCITKFCFDQLNMKGAEEAKVEQEFPDYVKVIPANLKAVKTVSINALRTFCTASLKSGLVSSFGKAGTFCYAPGAFIFINVEYVNTSVEAFAKLGFETVDIGIHDTIVLIAPAGKIKEVATLNTPFVLLALCREEDPSPGTCRMYFNLNDGTVVTSGITATVQLQRADGAEQTLRYLSNGKWFEENPDHTLTEEAIRQALREQGITNTTEAEIPPQEDYLDRVVAAMHDKYAHGERATPKVIRHLAQELGIANMGMMWEAVELSWLLWYKMLYEQPGPFEGRLKRMVDFWNNLQPTYAYSDSSKELYKQYSTPCPIAAIVSEYTGMAKANSIFEPSAGNGLFALGADPLRTHVNEIDTTRLESLKFQGFKRITSVNAAQPFPDDFGPYDVIITNPPFTRWEEDQFDKDYIARKYFDNQTGLNHHLRLEHVMAGLALHTMKDNGKAAIIILGHLYFGEDGFLRKFRPFFNWLYRHYHVEDVINMNSFKLYNKQGAIERTMLILINGRKQKPEGVAPLFSEAPHLGNIVNSFEQLWERVRKPIPSAIDLIIQQLKLSLAA